MICGCLDVSGTEQLLITARKKSESPATDFKMMSYMIYKVYVD